MAYSYSFTNFIIYIQLDAFILNTFWSYKYSDCDIKH